MKRIRDIFRCPKSFRLRCFRPRCLCAEDDVSRCQSPEEVYHRSGYCDAGVKPKPKASAKPSETSFHYLLPGQCEEITTQEELNVPEEPELKLQVEELPETSEVNSIHDFYVSEEKLHVPSEPEGETEVEALPAPPEAASSSDFPESEQVRHVTTESELQHEVEVLLGSPEATSIYDFTEFEEELQIPIDAETETEVEALPAPPEAASSSDFPESEQERHVTTESELQHEVEVLLGSPEATSIYDFTEFEEELQIPIDAETETEIEALSVPPQAASFSDFHESEQELHVPTESELQLAVESLPDTPEDVSVCDLSESEEEVHLPTDISEAASSLQDFRCCAVLGEGSYGKVLLAEHKQTQDMFAIKALLKADIVKKLYTERLRYEKEIFKTVSSARHPFLINLFSSFQDEHHIFFVMEYAAGGDLLGNKTRIGGSFPEDRAVFYAACVVLGLEFLHQNKIVHRDLKLENVVLDKQGFAKVTDFGLSKAGMGFGDRTKSIVGTPLYMAPEIVSRQPYTRDVDWWSLGVLIYDMLGVEMPFDDDDPYQLAIKIINAEVSFPQDWSQESTSLVSQLLVKDPSQRLGSGEKGAEDVKAHPFFRDIEWRKLLLNEVRPPFLPPLSGPEDVSNFEAEFTSMTLVLTSPEGPALTQEQQDLFRDFEWTAKWTP